MLVASTIFAIPKEKIGVVYVDPDMVNMGEVVRELRRFSLVAFDEDLPPIEARVALPIMDADRSITINSVVQEFIRSNSATYGLNDGRLNILADNMQRWLTQALDLNALDRASVLFTHAEILVRNLLDLRVTGYYIALLYGNVASACSAKGDHVIAANLLYAELEIVSKREHKDELLATQAKLSLINIYMMAPVNSPIAYLQVIDFCHDILNYIVTISKTFPKAAVKFCLDMQIMLHYDTYESKWTVAIVEVARQIERILAELGPTSYSGLIQAIRQADSLIKDEKPYEAERLCQQVIDANELTGSWELESKRILLEALVLQKKWSIALTVSSEYKRLFGSSNFLFRLQLEVLITLVIALRS